MDKVLREWFNSIMLHARNNYGRDGWDCFVEGTDFSDFVSDVRENGIETYDAAMLYYTERCLLKADQREEHDAMAREGW